METINNVANAAAKAVWGPQETNQEPISGVKGNTTQGEPYDAGNMDPNNLQDVVTPGEQPKRLGESDAGAVGKTKVEEHQPKQSNGPKTDEDAASEKLQSPDAHPEEYPVPESVLEKPGPRPLEEVAKERGGDAGNIGANKKADGDLGSASAPGSEEPQEGQDKGAGEKYVKSSGLAAEGGDFDAAKPGAGREADRLIGQNGDATAGHSEKGTGQGTSKQTSDGEKRSLRDRIKAKLHRH